MPPPTSRFSTSSLGFPSPPRSRHKAFWTPLLLTRFHRRPTSLARVSACRRRLALIASMPARSRPAIPGGASVYRRPRGASGEALNGSLEESRYLSTPSARCTSRVAHQGGRYHRRPMVIVDAANCGLMSRWGARFRPPRQARTRHHSRPLRIDPAFPRTRPVDGKIRPFLG